MSIQRYSFLWACCLFFLAAVLRAEERVVYFDEIEPLSVSQSYGSLSCGTSVLGKPISIAGQVFDQGLGVHANSNAVYALDRQFLRFEAMVGVDDAMLKHTKSSVVFKVLVDGNEVFNSGVMHINESAKPVSVSVENAETLELVVTDAGDGIDCDHGDWGNARLITRSELLKQTAESSEAEPKAFSVVSPAISLDLSGTGKIVGMKAGKVIRPVRGRTVLNGCLNDGLVAVRDLPDGGKEFVRTVKNEDGNGATVTERFIPIKIGIRWEIEVVGLGDPWTTSIQRIFDYNASPEDEVLFWTAWSDPRCGRSSALKTEDIVKRDPATVLYPLGTEHNWADPLLPQPLVKAKLYYGLMPFNFSGSGDNCPFATNLFCIPMLSFLEPKGDFGLTIGQNPSNPMINLILDLTASGKSTLNFLRFRISKESPILLQADLVPHEADWRASLRWMRNAHPEYIFPPNSKAHEIAGTAAYDKSPGISEVCANADKFHKMAFKVNWQASWDFPFFGMYIPPTKNDEEKWKAFGGWDYSVAQYARDAKRMKEAGFYTLNYFNVFEIGTHTKWPPPERVTKDDADLWKSSTDFTYAKLHDGMLMMPRDPESCKGKLGAFDGKPVGSWAGSFIFDCAVPSVREFLLEQARLHIEKVPDSSGICIDRLDWMRWFNMNADDGISWFHDRPSRYLFLSWLDIMEDLGPLMHNAGKVIYVNNHDKRIDALRHADGIYDEFTFAGSPLNLTALLCISKPALGWTSEPSDLQPDPDAFFQKNIYLGVFPTAPLPRNCHSINPDPVADQFYLDYGTMMSLMRGKQWVLEPHCVEAKGGAAKVNLFQVPDGFVLPVCFARYRESVDVVIRNVSGLDNIQAEAYHPGEEMPVAVPTKFENGELTLTVPVKRGCAMVKLITKYLTNGII